MKFQIFGAFIDVIGQFGQTSFEWFCAGGFLSQQHHQYNYEYYIKHLLEINSDGNHFEIKT